MKTIDPDELDIRDALVFSGQKRVLNGGSGPRPGNRLHAIFRSSAWQEVRMDIDPATAPDVIGSITDMRSSISSAASMRCGPHTAWNTFTVTRCRRLFRNSGAFSSLMDLL
jgi:hypothetical protein